tara:strand:+ start:389 stop:592 length:204 start_codon:yes stop_codon:yes gene_type:complete
MLVAVEQEYMSLTLQGQDPHAEQEGQVEHLIKMWLVQQELLIEVVEVVVEVQHPVVLLLLEELADQE